MMYVLVFGCRRTSPTTKVKEVKEVKDKDKYEYKAMSHNFYRSIPLPTEVKADEAEGKYDNGVLKVEVPKSKVVEKPKKKIEIQ